MEVLILSKRKALFDLPQMMHKSDICYYLSDDYLTLVEIKKRLDNKYNILTLGTDFHKAIKEIEKDFLSFCHRINFANQSEVYWGTHLASRNSASIPLLKHLVYFHYTMKLLDQAPSRIVLICDSPALAGVIEREMKVQGFPCHVKFSLLESLSAFTIYTRLFLKGVSFLVSGLLRWFYANLLKNQRISQQPRTERYILRSWVTAGNVDMEGRYKDRNFGELPEYLDQQGKDVWILPMFFNLDRNIFAQMKLMSRSQYKFIFPEQYLSVLDLLKTLRDGVKTISLDLNGTEFEGQDLSPVVKEIHLKSCLSPQLMLLNSVKYLIKKFAKEEVRIDRFVYPIENNAPEKPFILAARQYYPDSEIIGFQHTVWFKEQLGMYLHPEELKYHPLPDQIVCSGPRYIDILQKSGFPGKLLRPGPNLRYTIINQNFKSNYDNISHNEKMILIILNFDFNQTMELLEKLGMALRRVKDVKIYIKTHPYSPVKQLEKFLRDISFPEYEWAIGTILEWTIRVNVVIMTGGSVSNLETMTTGVPLIRISLQSNFDFDPLWDKYPFTDFLCSPDEIRHFINAVFQMSPSEKARLVKFGRKVVENYFEPVTSDNLRVFL